MKPGKNKVSITLDEDLVEQVKRKAEEDDRSFSQYVNLVLRTHLNELKQQEEKGLPPQR